MSMQDKREQAEILRALARRMDNADTRRKLQTLAAEFDRMASEPEPHGEPAGATGRYRGAA